MKKASFKLLALMLLATLFWVSVGETFHHHANMESEDDCGYCHWNLSSSNAVVSSTMPQVFPIFFVLTFFFPEAIVAFLRTPISQGRAPPISFC